uniref:Uncharacterized protein n=1 Tax=Daphnia galeata TaxID=27404 RepID=A0A8J2SD37_9CRUS|nr:unnamed protein product [Daphnia galeata]
MSSSDVLQLPNPENTAITLPLNWVLLDGSKSRAVDDIGIHKWLWTKLEGPNIAVLVGNGKAQVNVTGLKKGIRICVPVNSVLWDDSGVNGFDNGSVSVLQNDLGIQSWLWTRKPESLAAGAIIANSDRTSSSMLTNLVPGKYVFRLTVTDTQGLSDHDIATLIIHSNPRELDVVAIITLRSDPRSFTDRELTAIREQIALLLHQQGSVNININIDDVMVEPKSGYTRTVLQFFTTVWMGFPISVSNGADYNCGPKTADVDDGIRGYIRVSHRLPMQPEDADPKTEKRHQKAKDADPKP